MLQRRTWTQRSTLFTTLPFSWTSLNNVQTLASEDFNETKLVQSRERRERRVDFSSYEEAYEGRSLMDVLRALSVLRLCRSKHLVQNANSIIETSRDILGNTFTESTLRHTVFKQFCPGSTKEQALKTMRSLSSHGVGTIFDWVPTHSPSLTHSEQNFYKDVDANMRRIMQSIECAAMDTTARMVAVKLATITNIETLESVSCIVRQRQREDPSKSVAMLIDHTSLEALIQRDAAEIEDVKHRLLSLASYALQRGVRLLIDAEESEIQPAIDYVTLSVMEQANRSEAVVWNTYQCYLKNTSQQMVHDMEHLFSKKCVFGAKLVRGAYLQHETNLARKQDTHSVTFESKAQTDLAYDHCMKLLLDGIQSGERIHVCLATHNRDSIELAIDCLNRAKVDRRNLPVYFAQIYGMRDFLTYTLGHHGYKALKLLVFGDVNHVIPFLVRRAQENSSLLGGTQQDVDALMTVLFSRVADVLRPPFGIA